MSRRRKMTDEERIQVVQEYLDGKGSYMVIAKKYGISVVKLHDIVCLTREKGIEYIKSKEKIRVIRQRKNNGCRGYLSGKGSQNTICAKYGIKSRSILQ